MFHARILVKGTINLNVYCFECKRSLQERFVSTQALVHYGNFIIYPFGF